MEIETIKDEILMMETIKEEYKTDFDRNLKSAVNKMQRANLKVSIDYKPVVSERFSTDTIYFTALIIGRLK